MTADEKADAPGSHELPSRQTSDAEIREYTIGELQPWNDRIALRGYDPEWPTAFEREAVRLRGILGHRIALLEHVGSTSVVGLPAKPIIDIVLALPDSSDEASYVPDLSASGYVLRIREPHWFEHRMFKGPDTDINLHVFSRGCPEVAQMLLFRDWLRSHAQDRDLYARTKQELAERTWRFVQHYADAKTETIGAILARARAASP
ncbi:MAG TPA: GrpB family protein [Polyangiaceae bacterium]|nr:GrpB family protein [Polyangiaceae bacterium]